MTPQHRQAISRGLKKLQERRRRSAAMIESWKRRRHNNTDSIEATLNPFDRIEMAVKLWKGLETEKEWYRNNPEVTKLIENAITGLRLEIILACDKQLNASN